MNTAISVKGLNKSFDSELILGDFDLEVSSGKITAVFGPNGSGKSTLLNILSGLIAKDTGRFCVQNFNHYEFSYIFQNYRESLLPWRTNFENLAFPLEIQHKSPEEIRGRISELQKIFDFAFDWNAYPYQLSGGQQQIIAFMRALITKPKVLFIDEPFSALDFENNLLLREHLQKYFLAFKPTILLITHNIEEAVHLAEDIVILSKKPTRVLETIKNPLLYPRTVESLKTEEFHLIKDKVLTAFQKAIR